MADLKAKRIGVYMDDESLARCDLAIPMADCRSRSEFIKKAVDFYIAYLNTGADSRFLFPALDESMDGRMGDLERRLSRVLFKLGVEVAMMMHVVAASQHYDESSLGELREICKEEVARLSGRYSFEDAVRFQR